MTVLLNNLFRRFLGIDVSFCQGVIDWVRVKRAGVQFAYIRFGQGADWKDSQAVRNWKEAKKNNILRGVYWLWDERRKASAEDHFAKFLSVVDSDDKGELVPMLDFEILPVTFSEFYKFYKLAWGWYGKAPIIYSGAWFLKQVLPLPEWMLSADWWLTGWYRDDPILLANYELNVVIYQESDRASIDGIRGLVDRDYWYGDLSTFMRSLSMTEKFVASDSMLEKLNVMLDLIIEQSVECGGEPVLLPVPYISQLGEGADKYNNDCGAAAGVMLIEAYSGEIMSVDKFYEETGQSSDQYLNATQIMRVLRGHEVPCTWQENLSLNDLFTYLYQNYPLIVLINYGVIREAIETESNFSGPHFSTVVGLDIRSIFIHDPLWSDEGGKALAIPIDTFVEAWRSTPGNAGVNFGTIVSSLPLGNNLPVLRVRVTTSVLNVRSGPGTDHPINGNGLLRGEIVSILEVSGDWGKMSERHWIHLGYTESI